MNVIDDARHRRRVLHQKRLIAALKKMAALRPEPVETRRKRPLQPVHAGDQVRGGSFQGEVVVIPHDDEGVHPPRVPFTGFAHRGQKRLRCADGAKHVAPIIAMVDDVIARSLVLNAHATGHSPGESSPRERRQRFIYPICGSPFGPASTSDHRSG